jgi:decaprenyl-phosphate phosphoribosyltransferase
MVIRDLVEVSRPKHWVKNVFVFMPLPFALATGAEFDPVVFGLGLLAFCLANSAVYAFNDAVDAERDRLHPEKCRRPVASGRLSGYTARLWSLLLLALSVAVALASGSLAALGVLLVYVIFNLFYCLGGKHVALLDVFLLSAGFVLRVILGCALLEVSPSNWLLLCSSALALFMALAKRRGDLVRGMDTEHRPSLSGYSLEFLNQAMGITAAMTLIAYALYSLEAPVLVRGREFASLPFVVFGVLEYLRLVYVRQAGESPVDMLFRPELLLCGAGWLAAIIWSVQLP